MASTSAPLSVGPSPLLPLLLFLGCVALLVLWRQRAPRRRLSLGVSRPAPALHLVHEGPPPRPIPPRPEHDELGARSTGEAVHLEPVLPFEATRAGRPASGRPRRTCVLVFPAVVATPAGEYLDDAAILAAIPLPPPLGEAVPDAVPVPVPTGRLGEPLLTAPEVWPLALRPAPASERDEHERITRPMPAVVLAKLVEEVAHA